MSAGRNTEAARWFQQAGYDLQAVRWNIEGKFHDTACFLAQQTAEKAIKSLLHYLGARKKALLTHALTDRVEEAGKTFEIFLSVENDAKELDLHYVPARYPNGLPGGFPHRFYDAKMAERALNTAAKIFFLVKEIYQQKQETEILRES